MDRVPDRITYKPGENFDKTGMVISAKYSDGTTKVITDYTIENATNLTAGQDKITVKYTEDGETVTKDVKITVYIPIDVPTGNVLTYNGKTQKGVNVGQGYNIRSGAGGQTGATNVGKYTCEVWLDGDYMWTDGTRDDKVIPWEIIKADPDYTVPKNLTGILGKELSTVTLPEPENGTWTWNEPNTVMDEAGNQTFKATFTPNDKDNYNVMEDIEITVNVTENIPDTYKITVLNGKADYTEAEEGTTVTITANVPDDKKFVNWTSEDGVEFADATAEETTFKMLGKAVRVTANLEDKEEELQTVEKPAFSPNGGKFTDSVEVSILCATQGAAIYYTTDGETWNEYTEPFTITETTTVKAYAAKDGFENSDKVSATFTKVEDTTDEVTVTFDSNGGSKVAKQTIEKGAKAEKPSNPKRSGYTFRGWYEDEDLKTKYDFSQPVNEDITLYARWRRSSGSSSSSSGTAVTYKVVIDDTENGAVESDKETVSKNTTVTITVKPDKDYEIRKVKVVDSNNNEIKLTDNGDGTYTFTMPASKVYVKATFKEAEKTDVKPEVKADAIKMTVGDIVMTLNGKAFYNDVAPVIVDSRTMVPIRVITEMFGGTADWNEETKEVTLTIDGKVIKMTVGVVLEEYGTAPAIISDRTFVPVRFVADELGAETSWDDATKTVTITKAVAE